MIASRRMVVPLIALSAIGVAAPALAADGGGGTATLNAAVGTGGSLGSRSVTTVVPTTMTTALNSAIATGALTVTVTEAARTGTASWSVTAQAGDLSDGTNTITKSNLTISGRSVTATPGTGGPTAPTGDSALGTTAATLFSNTGQSTASIYTGLYTSLSTMNLAIPNGTAVGAYTGTLTVTLI